MDLPCTARGVNLVSFGDDDDGHFDDQGIGGYPAPPFTPLRNLRDSWGNVVVRIPLSCAARTSRCRSLCTTGPRRSVCGALIHMQIVRACTHSSQRVGRRRVRCGAGDARCGTPSAGPARTLSSSRALRLLPAVRCVAPPRRTSNVPFRASATARTLASNGTILATLHAPSPAPPLRR
ncbi:hypothetical protein DFH09DRAFT_1316462 [Mycena vulgaris]|nr:hypothetical protein DFH09DRAFT_1316462 [Mycena vulgaris]